MTSTLDVNAAYELAQKFLARKRSAVKSDARSNPAALPDRVGTCSEVFWWDDQTPLFEFPFFRNGDTSSHGYVMISSTQALPPVLESSWDAPPLSSQLNSDLITRLAQMGEGVRSVRWLYFGSLDLVAELEVQGRPDFIYLTIPEFEPIVIPTRLNILRNPRSIWSADEVAQRWETLENWVDHPLKMADKILRDRAPKRYQQNCNAYSVKDNFSIFDGDTYCSPHCIAGCYPVAWAMVASSYKQINQSDSNSKIWPNSTCWRLEWPSTTNPSRCQEVSDTIWTLHELLGTTCNGSSYDRDMLNGVEIYKRWGLNWRWHQAADQGYEMCVKIIDALQVFPFGARGIWASYLRKEHPELLVNLPRGGTGKVGHAVACYGYENGGIRISLGWGSGYHDKTINVSDYADNFVIYVIGYDGFTKEPKDSVAPEPAVATA